MNKRETFLLILTAAFFMLLLSVLRMPGRKPETEILSLTKVFNSKVEVVLVGDIMLGRSVMTRTFSAGNFNYPFLKVAERLKEADIVFANLENPIVVNCPQVDSGMKFCTSPELVEGLRFANISVVTIANNHIGNYGLTGIAETKRFLIDYAIDYVGSGNLAVKEVKGIKFGFLGFDFTTVSPTDLDYRLVRQSEGLCDVLIVGVHWGQEYQTLPAESQKEIARKLVGAGADVISGHHPHVVGSREEVNGKPTYYSLGNFIFDQMWSEETKKGLAVKLTFRDGKLMAEEELPIYMSSLGQPEFVEK